MLLASKFAAQVLLFFVPVLAFVPDLLALLCILPASFGVALLISRGRYLDILRGQWVHLDYYRRKMQYELNMVAGRNQWQHVLDVQATARESGWFSMSTLRAILRLYTVNTYLLSLFRGPIFLVLIVLLLSPVYGDAVQMLEGPAVWLLSWAFVWLVPFVLTSTKHVRFLGEAERYAEYAVCPAAILVGVGVAVVPLSIPVLIALGIYAVFSVLVIGHAWVTQARAARKDQEDREALVEALSELPPGSTLLGIPAMQVLAPISYRLPHRYADITTDGVQLIWLVKNLYEGYPWPKPDWDVWKSHGVEYVVTVHLDGLRRGRPSLNYDFSKLRKVFSNSSYYVYAL